MFFNADSKKEINSNYSTKTMHSSDFSDSAGHLTFALVLVPGVDTVLHAVAHQSVVDAHVAVTEERVCFTRSWRDTWKTRVNFNFISVKIYFPEMLSSTFHSDGIIMIKLMLGCPRMPGNTFGLESGLLLPPPNHLFFMNFHPHPRLQTHAESLR